MKNETFTPERIKAEADAFFEWDGEDRSLVTTTSCLLFAQHIAGLMQARAAQPAPVVPEGYVLVPIKPTIEMVEAGYEEGIGKPDRSGHARVIEQYDAMLAAAPAQGQHVNPPATTCVTDCRSLEGVAVGIIDAVITLARLFKGFEVTHPVLEALRDLRSDGDVLSLITAPAQGQQVETTARCFCGGPYSKNPHEDAGKPTLVLEVGAVYECIPCLTKSRHEWSKRATAAESALSALKAHPEAYQFDGQVLCDEHGNYLAEFMAYEQSFIDRLLHPQPALKAQQVGQEPEPAPKQHPDDAAVDRFAAAMKAKLARSREKGRHGWQNCTAPHLSAMLYDHLYKADPLDVGNFAMMLHQNGQAIELPFEARGRHTTPQPAPAQDVACQRCAARDELDRKIEEQQA